VISMPLLDLFRRRKTDEETSATSSPESQVKYTDEDPR
jgi:hypothetical protein